MLRPQACNQLISCTPSTAPIRALFQSHMTGQLSKKLTNTPRAITPTTPAKIVLAFITLLLILYCIITSYTGLSTGLSDDQSDSIKTDQRTVDYYLVRLSNPIAPYRVQDSTDVQRCDIIGIKPKGSQSSADAYEGACYPF